MDKQKLIVILVLVAVVAVFLILTVRGTMTAPDTPKNDATRREEQQKAGKKKGTKEDPPPPAVKNLGAFMGRWFGRFLPKIKMRCAVQPSAGSKNTCDGLPLNSTIDIAADNNSTFRIASLVLVRGKAEIEYDDDTDTADKADLDEQDFTLPDQKYDPANESAIIAFAKGGRLKISCLEDTDCQVALK